MAPLERTLHRHQHDLSLDVGTELSYLPRSWVRAAILVRINSLISGCSAVRPVVAERMQDLLRHDIVPMIPLRGSISASGDLSPLSYISGAIQGKSTIRVLSRDHRDMYADTALHNAGMEPVEIQAKEGLAVTNGTAISAAAAALVLHDTHSLAIVAQVLTAMSVEALNGTTESFHPFFSEVRPHPGQVESAQNILSFLAGSKLTKVNTGANAALRQDRYSIRTAPQWIGPILEDLALAHQQISIECNSATDNPLVTPEGEFLHGGNFQAKAVTSAMEKTRQGIQGIGRMLFSQCTEIINPTTNRGLTANLVAEDPSTSLIFKGTDLSIAALTAELGFLANPVNHVQTAEMGNQSLNSLALVSARYTNSANEVLAQMMATQMVAVCQALDLRAMHVQFLDLYRPQFSALVATHYGNTNETDLAQELNVVPNTSNHVDTPENSTMGINGNAKHQTNSSGAEAPDQLLDLLWFQLLVSFDTTASMDARDRFAEIARSLRPVLLDHPTLKTTDGFVARMDVFTAALGVSLQETWCAHRDAYLVHGDATAVLGKASKQIYTFLRRTLKVPLLATRHLSTPTTRELEEGVEEAPTVGSFNGAVYRALRDGTLAKIATDLLEVSLENGSE